MAIDPNGIQLTAEQRQLIANLAEQQGRTAQDVLADFLGPCSARTANGSGAAPSESVHHVGQRLGLFAALEDGPPDLSTNPRYFLGFGQRVDGRGSH
jgi:hypothetical protein